MTETTHEPPPPPPPPPPLPPPQLVRDPDDQVVAGVCAAFGRYTDTDPVLWRVSVAVLTLFGGAGLVLYALGWVLVPRLGEQQSLAERVLGGPLRGDRPDRGITPTGVVLVLGAVVLLLAVLDDGPGFGALLVLGGIAYLVARERRSPRPGPAVPPPGTAPYETTPFDAAPYGPAPFDTAAYDPAAAYGAPPPYSAPPPGSAAPVRRERRPRSPLGALTVSVATFLTGLLLALRLSGVESLTAPRIFAVALLVVGAGLLVSAWIGRARWLIPVGLLLALALGASVAARDAGLEDGVGDRTWTPTRDASYSLAAGEAVLDLADVPPGERVEIDAEVGLGRLLVLVPRDVSVTGRAQAGMGELVQVWPGGRREVLTADGDSDVTERLRVPGAPGGPEVELDLEVGMGQIEVRRGAA